MGLGLTVKTSITRVNLDVGGKAKAEAKAKKKAAANAKGGPTRKKQNKSDEVFEDSSDEGGKGGGSDPNAKQRQGDKAGHQDDDGDQDRYVWRGCPMKH